MLFMYPPHPLTPSPHTHFDILHNNISTFANAVRPSGKERSGAPWHTGEGAGTGKTVNVCWGTRGPPWSNTLGYGDVEYREAMDNVVVPIAKEFSPEMVFIFSGMDAGTGDGSALMAQTSCVLVRVQDCLYFGEGIRLIVRWSHCCRWRNECAITRHDNCDAIMHNMCCHCLWPRDFLDHTSTF